MSLTFLKYLLEEDRQDTKMPDTKVNGKRIGIIKRLEDTYGFVADQEVDRFFHWSMMDSKSLKPFHRLQIGDRVYFTPEVNGDKPQALNVSVVPFERKSKVM